MLYSSSFDALKKALVGIAKYIQATDESEASKEAVEEKLRSTDRAWGLPDKLRPSCLDHNISSYFFTFL